MALSWHGVSLARKLVGFIGGREVEKTMDHIWRYNIEGAVIELPLKFDERSQKYLEDYGDVIETPVYTPDGRPVFLTIEDACPHAEMVDDDPLSIDCGACKHYRQAPGTLLGVCHCEAMRRQENTV